MTKMSRIKIVRQTSSHRKRQRQSERAETFILTDFSAKLKVFKHTDYRTSLEDDNIHPGAASQGQLPQYSEIPP